MTSLFLAKANRSPLNEILSVSCLRANPPNLLFVLFFLVEFELDFFLQLTGCTD